MQRDISALTAAKYDVLVIGAGITGACVALDCAQRGLSVALVEKHDFGEAASANSLKVLHGGIRYLQHFDIPRLRESCAERAAFLRIAPQHTRAVPFMMPTYGHAIRGKEVFGAALGMLRLLTLDKISILDESPHSFPIGGFLSRQSVRSRFPYVQERNLTGAGIFYDGQVTDPTRLVLSIVRSAVDNGATAINYCGVTGLQIQDNRIDKVLAEDRLTDDPLELCADMVVNATGPFSSRLSQQLIPDYPGFEMPLSRDMAFVLNRRFDREYAVALQTVHKDHDALINRGNRHIFMVPWHDRTLIGVDSKFFQTNPYDLDVGEDEIELFLREINSSLVDDHLSRDDIQSVYAGLLPCEGQDPGSGEVCYGKRSLIIDHSGDCGLLNMLSVAAVRLTIGRKVAEKATDLVVSRLERKAPACRTTTTPVWGGDISDFTGLREEAARALSASKCEGNAERLVRLYGSRVKDVLAVAEEARYKTCIGGTNASKCEVVHAIRSEMAVHLADYIMRRSELSWSGKVAEEVIEECADLFADELGWDAAKRKDEIADVLRQESLGRDFGV